jgi:hypothetical protein
MRLWFFSGNRLSGPTAGNTRGLLSSRRCEEQQPDFMDTESVPAKRKLEIVEAALALGRSAPGYADSHTEDELSRTASRRAYACACASHLMLTRHLPAWRCPPTDDTRPFMIRWSGRIMRTNAPGSTR